MVRLPTHICVTRPQWVKKQDHSDNQHGYSCSQWWTNWTSFQQNQIYFEENLFIHICFLATTYDKRYINRWHLDRQHRGHYFYSRFPDLTSLTAMRQQADMEEASDSDLSCVQGMLYGRFKSHCEKLNSSVSTDRIITIYLLYKYHIYQYCVFIIFINISWVICWFGVVCASSIHL